jgi:hypothetical protein
MSSLAVSKWLVASYEEVIHKFEFDPASTGSYRVDTDTNISRISPRSITAGYISSSGLSVSTVAEIMAT